jgi:hypothetical protein
MIFIRQAKYHAWETCLRDMTHTWEASSETRVSKREIPLYDIYIYMIFIYTWGDARGLGLVSSGAQALWPAHYSNHTPWRIDNIHTRRISSMISLFLLPPHPLCAIHIGGPRGQGGEPRSATSNTHPPEGDSSGTSAGVRFEQQIGSHRICNTDSEPWLPPIVCGPH